MHLLNVEDVHKSYGVRPLLDGVSLGIDSGERIGVVGLNGGGKTTLLEVLAGVEPVDGGRISRVRGMRLAVVTQRTTLPRGVTIADVVLADFAAEHEWAADARVRSIVTGLGLLDLGLSCDVDTLSGGERRRVALAAALVQDLELLVLDEPTNHLDVEGVRWLADHLRQRRCSCVVVTHDRWFLDTVCTRTWEVTDGRVESYEGGYSDWIYARAERTRLSAQAEEKRRNLARKELAWLQRGAKARTSKPKYRIEAAEALISDVPEPRDSVELVTFAKRRLGKTVVELEDVTLRLGETTLLDEVTWRIGPGDRIGLVGVNGSGKTTLLRLLAGEVAERERLGGDGAGFAGRRIEGKTVRLAHLTQELSDLPTASRVLEAVEEIALRVTLGKYELSASQLCERFGFGKSRQWTPVGELSGGERRRLQLARLLMGEPNVLLLDEPTNDLDIDTLQQLEDLLDSWPGTLVVVSHDRYLVERVCDSVVALFGDGGITDLPGGIDEYLSRRKKAEEAGESGTPAGRAAGSEPAPSRPADTRTSAAEQRAAQKTIARVERRMLTIDKKESSLHELMAAAGGDTGRLRELDGELTVLREEKDRLEAEWLAAVETTG